MRGRWRDLRGGLGTVTIEAGSTVTPSSLTFTTSGYVITGGNAASQIGLGSTVVVSAPAGGTATISAVMSGTGGLDKQGDGTLIVTGANTFTGGTTVTAGTLVNAGGTLGTVNNTAGATFTNASGQSGDVTNAGTASNSGTVASLANAGGVFTPTPGPSREPSPIPAQ